MIYLENFKLLIGDDCRKLLWDVEMSETKDEYYPANLFFDME